MKQSVTLPLLVVVLIVATDARKNIALRKPTFQSSTSSGGSAERAVDGNADPNYPGNSCTHTSSGRGQWWAVDLGEEVDVAWVEITNRKDCCSERLAYTKIGVTNTRPQKTPLLTSDKDVCAAIRGALDPGQTKSFPCVGSGRYVIIQQTLAEALTLCEVKVYAAENLALGKPTYQSSTSNGGSAYKAVDGIANPDFKENSCTHTWNVGRQWWAVDLGKEVDVARVAITNRGDCCSDRLAGAKIGLSNDSPNLFINKHPATVRYTTCNTIHAFGAEETRKIACVGRGRYLYIQQNLQKALTLCEVKVFAREEDYM